MLKMLNNHFKKNEPRKSALFGVRMHSFFLSNLVYISPLKLFNIISWGW